MCVCVFVFFFFKQKTAYEIGTGDWSSDVCSSDLKSTLHLHKSGLDVSVYALEDDHSAEDLHEWAPVEPHVMPVRLGTVFPYAPTLETKLDEGGHNILHLHGLWQLQSRSVSRWKKKTGRPVMVSPRGMLDPWALAHSGWKKRIVGAWFENRNLEDADCLHALNASEAQSMRSYGLKNPIAIIPNATDLPDIDKRKQREGSKTILFLGRLHPKKGLMQLVKAWSSARRLNPGLVSDWRLQIAGWDDGGHAETLEALISELGLASSVAMTGPAHGTE